jgi:plastocyanin
MNLCPLIAKMGNRRRKQRYSGSNKFVFSRNAIIAIAAIGVIISVGAYFAIKSMVPVNGNVPVFGAPKNNFFKASHNAKSGFFFVGQSAGGTRKGFSPSVSGNSNITSSNNLTDSPTGPTLYVSKGGLESIHFINEDYDTHSKHNFNIDEFKVHSKDLGYFQSQIITFIVDKDGVFEYYCSIHPEMRGKVVVM